MILLPDHQIAVVHIPKCGGTSLRTELKRLENICEFNHIASIEKLGTIDLTHMNLKLLRQSFPDVFQMLLTFDSYCIVRDPFSRFRSSFEQRLRMYRGKSLGKMRNRDLMREFDLVVDTLSRSGDWLPHDFCHFERQSGYIFIDETRIIKNVFAIHHLNEMKLEILNKVQLQPIEFEPMNSSVVERKFLSEFSKILGAEKYTLISSFFSSGVKKNLRRLTHRRPTTQDFGAFKLDPIDGFIREYYRDDIELWRQIERAPGPSRLLK